MYRLSWELAPMHGEGRREATVVALSSNCSLGHALVEAALVISRETVRLHSLTLAQLYPNLVVRGTILRYERDGL